MQYCFEAEPIEVHGVVVASYGSECCLILLCYCFSLGNLHLAFAVINGHAPVSWPV